MDHRLVTFVVAAAIFIVIPGPSVVFTIGRALTVGRSAALATVVGNALGVFVQVLAVAFGVGQIVAQSAATFTVLKVAGAVYLIYLGVMAIRHRHGMHAALSDEAGVAARSGLLRSVGDGFLVGLLNPKAIIFYLAFLPQFVNGAGTVTVTGQIVGLGAICIALGLVLDSLWAIVAGAERTWLARSPHRLAAVGSTGGLAMIGLGVGVAATGQSR